VGNGVEAAEAAKSDVAKGTTSEASSGGADPQAPATGSSDSGTRSSKHTAPEPSAPPSQPPSLKRRVSVGSVGAEAEAAQSEDRKGRRGPGQSQRKSQGQEEVQAGAPTGAGGEVETVEPAPAPCMQLPGSLAPSRLPPLPFAFLSDAELLSRFPAPRAAIAPFRRRASEFQEALRREKGGLHVPGLVAYLRKNRTNSGTEWRQL